MTADRSAVRSAEWAEVDPVGVFRRSAIPTFLLNSAGEIALANRALGEFFNLPADRLARWSGAAAGALHPPADLPLGHTRRALRQLRDGEPPHTLTFTALPDEAGRLLGVLGMIFVEPAAAGGLPFVHSAQATGEWDRLRTELRQRFGFDDAPARSLAGERLLHQCAAAVAEDGPVTFVGPAGSGKTWWARALHAKRKNPPPMVVFDVAALTPEAQERFLFGDAESETVGALEPARPLWLIVREPTNLAVEQQARLAAVAEERRASLRMLVTARASLEDALRDGRLERRFYYFVTRRRIEAPPLAERREEIPDFCAIWQRQRTGDRFADLAVEPGGLAALAAYDWPGNIRELFAVLDAARLRKPNGPIAADDLALRVVRRRSRPPTADSAPISLPAVLERVERRLLDAALARFAGNKSKAAEHVGLSRAKFLRRFEQLHAESGPKESADENLDLKDSEP